MAVRSTVRKLSLYSSIPHAFLLSQFDIGLLAGQKRDDLLSLWTKANQAYNNLGGPQRSFVGANDLMAINGLDKNRVESVLKLMKLYSPHDSHATGLYNVRLSKLVTPQLLVNQKRAEERANVRSGMSSAELFDVVASSPNLTEPMTKQILGMTQDNGAFLFTTMDEDVRNHMPVYRRVALNDKDKNSPEFDSLSFPIGGRYPPFANVYRIRIDSVNTRLIINNGVHRLFSLASKGNIWCPLVVTDMSPQEIPDPFVNFNREFLVNPQSNPPLLMDFLNKHVTIPLDYFPCKNTIKVNYTVERYPTIAS